MDSPFHQMSHFNDPSEKTKLEDTYGIVGKSLTEVADKYSEQPMRIAAINSQSRYLSSDYVPGRINLNISTDGTILSYTIEQ